ncbi:MAG: hypothetical protein AABX37_03730, partial [Nanoarchaeota archaeon]
IIGIISLVLIILFSVFLVMRSGPFAGKAVQVNIPGSAGIIEQRGPFADGNVPLVIDVYPLQDAHSQERDIYGFDVEVVYPSASFEVLPNQVIQLSNNQGLVSFTIKYKDTVLDADNHKLTIQGFHFEPYEGRFKLQGLNLKIKEGVESPSGTISLIKVQLNESNSFNYITTELLNTRESNWEFGGVPLPGANGRVSLSAFHNQAGADIQDVAQGQDFSLDLSAVLPADKKALVGQFQVRFDPTKVDAPTFNGNALKHIQVVEGATVGFLKTFTFMVIPESDAAAVVVDEYALAEENLLGTLRFHVKANAAIEETGVIISTLKMYEENGTEISFDLPAPVGISIIAGEIVDTDGDDVLDAADTCPNDAANDADNDGICVGAGFANPKTAGNDNCPIMANVNQEDTDSDGIGDVCDQEVEQCAVVGDEDEDGQADCA